MTDQINLLNYIKDAVDRVEKKVDGHDARVREVEKWQSNFQGKMTIITAAVTAFSGFIGWLLSTFKGQLH